MIKGSVDGQSKVLQHIVLKGVLKNFVTVKEEFNLERDFFRFLQIRHYVGTITKDMNLANLEEGIMKIFVTSYNSGDNTKIISRLYNYFMNRNVEGTIYISKRDGIGRVAARSPMNNGSLYVKHRPKLQVLYP